MRSETSSATTRKNRKRSEKRGSLLFDATELPTNLGKAAEVVVSLLRSSASMQLSNMRMKAFIIFSVSWAPVGAVVVVAIAGLPSQGAASLAGGENVGGDVGRLSIVMVVVVVLAWVVLVACCSSSRKGDGAAATISSLGLTQCARRRPSFKKAWTWTFLRSCVS